MFPWLYDTLFRAEWPWSMLRLFRYPFFCAMAAALTAFLLCVLATPFFARAFRRGGFWERTRHFSLLAVPAKRHVPTMGGAVIIGSAVAAYAAAHLVTMSPPTVSGLLVLFLMSGLGLVGFLDDYIKISRQRSLGLRAGAKFAGQALVSVAFAVLALQFENEAFLTPASTRISFIRDTPIDLAFAGAAVGLVLFVLWAFFMIAAESNGVNLTDGLDGLATGATVATTGAYVLIGPRLTTLIMSGAPMMGVVLACPPGVPLSAKPKRSLFTAPSI